MRLYFANATNISSCCFFFCYLEYEINVPDSFITCTKPLRWKIDSIHMPNKQQKALILNIPVALILNETNYKWQNISKSRRVWLRIANGIEGCVRLEVIERNPIRPPNRSIDWLKSSFFNVAMQFLAIGLP